MRLVSVEVTATVAKSEREDRNLKLDVKEEVWAVWG